MPEVNELHRRLVCELDEETVDRYSDWTECVAFRFVRVDETHVRLELSSDLDRITDPGAE